MLRFYFIVGFSLLSSVSQGHAQLGPLCSLFPELSVPTDAECANECCTEHVECFEEEACSFPHEYPAGVKLACELCNTDFQQCIGLCILGRPPFPASPPSCTPVCEQPLLACGMPDGCGGRCMTAPSCNLLIRRPEFLVVL
jgi:hypothetical protein